MSQTEKTIQNYQTLREQQGWADAIKKYLSEKYETPPLAHVHSFGCQQSVYDGERFKGVLAQLAMALPMRSVRRISSCIIHVPCGKMQSSVSLAMWGRLRVSKSKSRTW